MLPRPRFVGSLVALAFTLSACQSEPTATADAEMTGGESAYEPELAAVGTVLVDDQRACLGTLVAPRIVVTARHCRISAKRKGFDPDDVSFLLRRYIDGHLDREAIFHVVGELTSGPEGVGAGGLGRDVTIYVLDKPVPSEMGITPIPVRRRPLDESDVGKKLVKVGIDVWQRVKGQATLDSVSGKPYRRAFGTKEVFESALGDIGGEGLAERVDIDFELDEAAHEVHTGLTGGGLASGDVQACRGDSGGPLLEQVDGHYELVGITTGGEESGPRCVLGGIDTKLGSPTQEALRTLIGEAPWASSCGQPDPTDLVRSTDCGPVWVCPFRSLHLDDCP